jgi:ATP-binding cassette subfamily F protein 3
LKRSSHYYKVSAYIGRYNAKRASLVQSRIKMLEKLPVLEPVVTESTVTLRFPDVDKLSPPILMLR